MLGYRDKIIYALHMTKKKKKIILAVTKSNWGGAQRYVFDIAANLDKNVFDVSVLCGGGGILAEKLRQSGIRVITLPYLSRDIKFFDEFHAFFDLVKIFYRERPDIVHLNSPKMGGLGALAVRAVNIFFKLKAGSWKLKAVYTVHGWSFFEDRFLISSWSIAFLSWLTALLAHKTIVISKKDRDAAMRFPFTKEKIVLIYNGLGEISFFEKYEARKELVGEEASKKHLGDFWVCTVAELHPNKNIAAAIKGVAAAKKAGQKIFYVIIGEGEEKEKLSRLIEKENAAEYVKMVGFKKDAAHYLSAFDCFLLTSKKEGLPYVLLEAGLAGLTVVATGIGGIPDIVENSVTGYLLKNNTEKSIFDALQAAQKRPLGQELKRFVGKEFSLETFLRETEKMYN